MYGASKSSGSNVYQAKGRQKRMGVQGRLPGESNLWVGQKGVGTSLAVQWLRLRASTAGGTGLIPGQGTKIPPKKKKKGKMMTGSDGKFVNQKDPSKMELN